MQSTNDFFDEIFPSVTLRIHGIGNRSLKYSTTKFLNIQPISCVFPN